LGGDLHFRKEPAEEVAGDALERQEKPSPADRGEPRQQLRHFDAGETLLATVGIANEDAERRRKP
jgi:hypothetical protein